MTVRRPTRPVGWALRLVLATIGAIAMMATTSAVASAAPDFTLTAKTDPAGDTTNFSFHITAQAKPGHPTPSGFPQDVTIAGGQTKLIKSDVRGYFTVKANPPGGWHVSDIQCDQGNDDSGGQEADDKFVIDLGGGWSRVELSPNEHKSCTFVFKKESSSPPPSPAPSPAPAPAPAPKPRPHVRSHARLHAPTGCVIRRYPVSVRGGHVRRVRFFVNGKRVRTVRARPGQRRFSVVLPPPPKPKAHVVAEVTFRSNARPRQLRLRATIPFCGRAKVKPKFTG